MYRRMRGCASRRALAGLTAVAGIAIALSTAPAASQNLFDFLFGGIRRVLPANPPVGGYAPHRVAPMPLDPSQSRGVRPNPRGPRTGFCVRLCDGRYFPVRARRNVSTAEQCNSFCPASATKVFSGSVIDHAVAGDGRRYADLPNAFAYRQRMVPGCTCDGKSAVGLASIPIEEDETLRPGDIVATNSGLTVYNGRDPRRDAAFTPIESAKIPKSLRKQLADVKVAPRLPPGDGAPASAPQDQMSSISGDPRLLSARAQ